MNMLKIKVFIANMFKVDALPPNKKGIELYTLLILFLVFKINLQINF